MRLTAKRKPLRITIDREALIKPKKEKEPKSGKHRGDGDPILLWRRSEDIAEASAATTAHPESVEKPGHFFATSQQQANRALAEALGNVFAASIDQRMIATLPEYWKLFYDSASAHAVYRPAMTSILRQSDVDRKAMLVSMPEPLSNEFAQKNGVAGMAMYSVVIGADGKPQQIAVGRPIGFGLDENAVDALRHATFQPALKENEPVAVFLDLVVQFRIYSKLTAAESARAARNPALVGAAMLPGPYTANAPRPQPEPAAVADEQPAPPAGTQRPASSPANSAPESHPAAQPTIAPQPTNSPQ